MFKGNMDPLETINGQHPPNELNSMESNSDGKSLDSAELVLRLNICFIFLLEQNQTDKSLLDNDNGLFDLVVYSLWKLYMIIGQTRPTAENPIHNDQSNERNSVDEFKEPTLPSDESSNSALQAPREIEDSYPSPSSELQKPANVPVQSDEEHLQHVS